MRPMLPSWIRSRSWSPRLTCFFASDTTRRRFASTSSAFARSAVRRPAAISPSVAAEVFFAAGISRWMIRSFFSTRSMTLRSRRISSSDATMASRASSAFVFLRAFGFALVFFAAVFFAAGFGAAFFTVFAPCSSLRGRSRRRAIFSIVASSKASSSSTLRTMSRTLKRPL